MSRTDSNIPVVYGLRQTNKDRQQLVLVFFVVMLLLANVVRKTQLEAWADFVEPGSGQEVQINQRLLSPATISEQFIIETKPDPRLIFLVGEPLPINHTDAATLELLPEVGPSLAAEIIAYRTLHGPILSMETLEQIPGFGTKLSSKLDPFLSYLP